MGGASIAIGWDSQRRAYRLTTSVLLPAPRSEVFRFFSNVENLESLTPPWLNFRILTSTPLVIQQGSLIDYRIRVRFIPIRWRTEISQWEPERAFTDRQIRGPYRMWEHQHIFTECESGTRVDDLVHYRVPGGWLVHWLIVRSDLQRIFAYRQQVMLDRFGPGGSAPPAPASP